MEPGTPIADKAESDFVTPERALRALERRFGDPLNAKLMMADLIRDGRIRVTGVFRSGRASCPPTGSEADLNLPESERGLTITSKRVLGGAGGPRTRAKPTDIRYDVSPAFWSLSENWAEDISQRWNWRTGKFAIKTKRDDRQIQGVMFYRTDVEREAAADIFSPASESAAKPAPASQKNLRGHPRGKDWNDWIAELVVFVYEGDYELGMPATTVVKLVNARLEKLGLEVPDSTKVDRAAAATIKRLAAVIYPNSPE